MDPDANLLETRELVQSLIAQLDDTDDDGEPIDAIDTDDVDRLCELVQALDVWLCHGGFLPKDWRR